MVLGFSKPCFAADLSGGLKLNLYGDLLVRISCSARFPELTPMIEKGYRESLFSRANCRCRVDLCRDAAMASDEYVGLFKGLVLRMSDAEARTVCDSISESHANTLRQYEEELTSLSPCPDEPK
jgi:hypothetical protein